MTPNYSKEFHINNHQIGQGHPPFLVAEISANHNGSLERAFQTVLAAKNSGADAVKIQSYTPDTMTIKSSSEDFMINEGLWSGRTLYDLYSEAYTPFEWHKPLFEFGSQHNITIFSSPFDETALEILESLNCPAYKIASFELIDFKLVDAVSKCGKPMIMSTGMASLNEIGEALEIVKTNGINNVTLLHCISSYPTPLSEANLGFMNILKKEFDISVGLSDHTIDNSVAAIAAAIGAVIIEKHFTVSRSEGGVDSSFSLEPSEFSDLVQEIKKIKKIIGNGKLHRSEAEINNRKYRRSLYFTKSMKKGEKITENHIKSIRPGFGIPTKYYDSLVGRIIDRNVEKGDRVLMGDVEK